MVVNVADTFVLSINFETKAMIESVFHKKANDVTASCVRILSAESSIAVRGKTGLERFCHGNTGLDA